MYEFLLTGFNGGIALLVEYIAQHTLTCLIPAFFVAGLINAAVPKEIIMKILGSGRKWLAYPVASVSGLFLSVCSCTVIPFFAGVYKRGAGLGPALALLYSWPAINFAAFALTGSVFGMKMALFRALFAILLAFGIGNIVEFIFRDEERKRREEEKTKARAAPVISAKKRSTREVFSDWMSETWKFFVMIFPMLLVGVFAAGAVRALLPSELVSRYIGGNSLQTCFVVAIIGAFSYFSSLTEVPLTKALVDLGMGRGAALTEFLADPALSLPSALAVSRIIGWKKTLAYMLLVVVFSSLIGWLAAPYLY